MAQLFLITLLFVHNLSLYKVFTYTIARLNFEKGQQKSVIILLTSSHGSNLFVHNSVLKRLFVRYIFLYL